MARPVGLSLVSVSAVRTVTAGPVVADSATLNDTNFPPTPDATNGGAINGYKLSSIWVGAEFTGAAAPSVTVEVLIRDDGAADGSRWKRIAGFVPIVLDGTNFAEVRIDGRNCFLRITAVGDTPTKVVLLAFPGPPLPGRLQF